MSSNDDVDAWISQLMQCKPLSEAEVKKLCDKVRFGCDWGVCLGCGPREEGGWGKKRADEECNGF